MTVEQFISSFTPPCNLDLYLRHLYDVWDKEMIELDAIQRVSEETRIPIVKIVIMCINDNHLNLIEKNIFKELTY